MPCRSRRQVAIRRPRQCHLNLAPSESYEKFFKCLRSVVPTCCDSGSLLRELSFQLINVFLQGLHATSRFLSAHLSCGLLTILASRADLAVFPSSDRTLCPDRMSLVSESPRSVFQRWCESKLLKCDISARRHTCAQSLYSRASAIVISSMYFPSLKNFFGILPVSTKPSFW